MNETEQNASAEDTPPSPPKPTHGGWWWLLVAVIGIGIAGGYAVYESDMTSLPAGLGRSEPEPTPTTSEPTTETIGGAEQFSRLQERVTLLEQQVSRLANKREQAPALSSRMEQMESKLDSLNIAANSELAMEELMALRRELDALKQTVDKQAEQPGEHRKARMLLAFDRLKEQILAGEPYDHALQAFALLNDHSEVQRALDDLATYQYRGVATQAGLKEALKTAIAAYYEQPEAPAESALEAVKQNLSQLVKVRKVGSAHSGEDAGARIARAEAALAAGQLDTAIAELKALAAPAREDFVGWLESAQRHQQARRRLNALEQAVIASVEQMDVPRTEPLDDRPTSSFGG